MNTPIDPTPNQPASQPAPAAGQVEWRNPFVGPRPLRLGEKIFGRERETGQLTNLLIAERIVLLYSPSGAGKTSLVQAAVMPRLRQRRFNTLPVMRVNLDPPEAVLGQAADDFNRYIFSALSSLEEARPQAERIPVNDLARLSFSTYLEQQFSAHEAARAGNLILIFDQFEEILTVNPTDQKAKQAFFDQVGAALQNRSIWALFSMREDFLGGIDPYLLPIPNRFSARFRLDLLGKDAARQVMQETAKDVKVNGVDVDFSEAAANRLLDDLCRVQLQHADGSVTDQPGQYVEPVQLQVVCRNLWERLEPGDTEISLDEVEKIGDVDQSLAAYYASVTEETARKSNSPEREIRYWFENSLISESGLRKQVMMETKASLELDIEVIRLLENAHLVRRDTSRGRTLFELTHDRLVRPVRNNNADWFKTHLSLLQRQARLWDRERPGEHLLLRETALEEAETWVKGDGRDKPKLTRVEEEFLEACRKFNESEKDKRKVQAEMIKLQEQARLARRLRTYLTLAIVAAVAAMALGSVAGVFWRAAAVQRDANAALAAESDRVAATSVAVAKAESTARSLADAESAAARSARQTAEAASDEALLQKSIAEQNARIAEQNARSAESLRNQALLSAQRAEAQKRLAVSRQLASQVETVRSNDLQLAALLAVESYLATDTIQARAALLGNLRSAEKTSIREFGRPIPKRSNKVFSLALSSDGERMAWGLFDSFGSIWNYRTSEVEVRLVEANNTQIDALAFSPDGSILAVGGDTLSLVDVVTGISVKLDGVVSAVAAVSFDPKDRRLAAAVGSQLRVWDTTTRRLAVAAFEQQNNAITSVAWSPDGRRLASGGRDGRVILWNPDNGNKLREVGARLPVGVTSVVWSPVLANGLSRLLAVGGTNGELIVLDVETNKPLTSQYPVRRGVAVNSLAYSPDGILLAVAAENDIYLYDTRTYRQVASIVDYHLDTVTSLAFRPGAGEMLLGSGSLDRTVGLHIITVQQPISEVVARGQGSLLALNSQVDRLLAVAADRGRLNLWQYDSVNPQTVTPTLLHTWGGEPPLEVNLAAFSPDASRLLVFSAGPDGPASPYVLRMLDTVSYSEIYSLTFGVAGPNLAPPLALAFSRDGRQFATSHCAEEIFNRRGNLFCTVSRLRLWDAASGEEIYLLAPVAGPLLETTANYLRALAFNPSATFPAGQGADGLLASAGAEASLIFWRLNDGQVDGIPLSSNGEAITSLAYDTRSSLLASGASDGSLLLWDPVGRQPLGEALIGPPGSLLSLAFTPSGFGEFGVLFAGSSDGTLVRWNIDPAFWVLRNCELAGRNFSRAEWEQYFPGALYRTTCSQWPAGE